MHDVVTELYGQQCKLLSENKVVDIFVDGETVKLSMDQASRKTVTINTRGTTYDDGACLGVIVTVGKRTFPKSIKMLTLKLRVETLKGSEDMLLIDDKIAMIPSKMRRDQQVIHDTTVMKAHL